ncbi:MAG: gliding motility-associated C-terminal domain-containing protein [Bacteroidales bacterium]|nr:gliding motility-associated C-terminal domain-containing protein [Bacteroidales bacterium]
MKRIFAIYVLLCVLGIIPASARNDRDTLTAGPSISFVENLGQWDSRVIFAAQLHNAAIFAEQQCLTVALREILDDDHSVSRRHHAYRVTFVGSDKGCTPTGMAPDEGYSNYYIGNDPSRWVSKVPSYAVVEYNDLYKDVDFRIFSAKNMAKYEFRVAPGADPSVIRMQYDGQSNIRLLSNGNLLIVTSVRDIVELRPYVYQEGRNGKQIEIKSSFKLRNNVVTFDIGDYDHDKQLVIDPVLCFSTYTGSTADNWGTAAAYDSHKNVYTAGLVFAVGYPTSVGAYDVSFNGLVDIGIFKFDSTGSQRMYATYLGGGGTDTPHSIFVNSFDELLVFGTTASNNFPTTDGAYSRYHSGGTSVNYLSSATAYPSGSDIFVSRFSSDGSALQASTYVGGSGNDGLNYKPYFTHTGDIVYIGNDSLYYNYGDGARGEIITDDQNNVYVGSTTFSRNFPTTPGAVRRNPCGKQDGVVFKLDYNLRTMIWSTYLGGTGDDAIYSIDVDDNYNIIVCGGTNSVDYPFTMGAFQSAYGGGSADGFITKISYNGDRIMSSTYFGSSEYDQCYFVRTGRNNEVLVFGQTAASGSTMISNATYNTPGAGMLLARFSPDLRSRRWSTTFGTPGRINLSPTAFCADVCNRIYAVGWGRDFVGHAPNVTWGSGGTADMEYTADAFQTATDGQDFYILSLSSDASTLEYASFFGEMHSSSNQGGGDHVDGGTSRFDKLGTLYQSVCASCRGTNGFPTSSSVWAATNGSTNCNNAVFRFNVHNDFPVADFLMPPVGCAPYSVTFTNTGRGTSFSWDFGDGTMSNLTSPSHTYSTPGTYTVTLVATKTDGCQTHDTLVREIIVLGNVSYMHDTLVACDGASVQIGLRPLTGCSYSWSGGSVSDPTVANPWVTSTGTYVLRTSVSAGCVQTDTFNVDFITLLDTLLLANPSCPGYSDGSATLRLTDEGQGSTWRFDGIATSDTVFGSLTSGASHILVITKDNCRVERAFRLSEPQATVYNKEGSYVLCNDSCTGWIHIWDGISNDTALSGLCPGSYTINLVDTNNCPHSDTTVIVRSHDLDSVSAWADSYNIFLGNSTTLHATRVSGATYLWSPAATLSKPTSASPVATPTDTVTVYTVTVTTPEGCTATDTVCIHCTEVICGEPNFVIPNAFTPNSDGVNDLLCFSGEFITSFYIAIFTRWGEKVYESDDINQCWDGRYNSNWCLPGVYTYTCTITCEAGKTNSFKGDITIIR